MGICVPGNADAIRHITHDLHDLLQDRLSIGLHLCTAALKHRPVFLIDDLYAQPFARNVDQELVFELLQNFVALNCLTHGVHQVLHAQQLFLCLQLFERLFLHLNALGLVLRLRVVAYAFVRVRHRVAHLEKALACSAGCVDGARVFEEV